MSPFRKAMDPAHPACAAAASGEEEDRVAPSRTAGRRRRKGISSASLGAMDQITVEFILPTAPKNGHGPHTVLLEVAGNWTVEQVSRAPPTGLPRTLGHPETS